MEPIALDPAALLAQDHRLRSLARALVRDGHAADDLAQEAWVAALESRGPIRAAPAWLATVLRRAATRGRRTEARRTRHEQHSARPEGTPSTQEILAREEARARVVAALAKLDEPGRTTLVLRFLEDLPPRAVARRMQVPVETVRTRTRRGLEELRQKLDGEYGARERWLAALVPLVSVRVPQAAPWLLLAAAAVVGLLSWSLWPTRSPAARQELPLVAVEPAGLQLSEPAATTSAPARTTRDTLPPPGSGSSDPAPLTSSLGDLALHLSWHDGTPAAGVALRVTPHADENPELGMRDARTDEHGDALVNDLPAGATRVRIDRRFLELCGEVRAGETCELALTLEAGFELRGRVTNTEDRPIGGAEIWLAADNALADGQIVAHSAADGSFHLRDLPHAILAARADGYQPSSPTMRLAEPGTTVDVHLRLLAACGELSGRVVRLGSDAPVADAWVRVGARDDFSDWNEQAPHPWGVLVRTDEAGEFRARGLAPGTCPLTVRAVGLASLQSEVEIRAGGAATCTLCLAPEAVLVGTVQDELGRPLARQRVRIGDYQGPFTASTLSAQDGSFRLGALEASRTFLAWIDGQELGSARLEFLALPGVEHEWNAVLVRGGEVFGRVLDERGEPLAGWQVRLEDEPSVAIESDDAFTLSEADGSFGFEGVHDRPHRLTAAPPRSAFVACGEHDVRPADDERLLRVLDARVPSARILATFLDESGSPVPGMNPCIVPEEVMFSPVLYPDPRTGAFDSGPLPPGRTMVYVRPPGRASYLLGPRTLAPEEAWDLGEIRLEPEGSLIVRLVAAELEPGPELELSIADSFEARFTGDGAERRSSPLRPGSHRLLVGGGEYENQVLPFELEPGLETTLEVALRRGWRARVALRVPPGTGQCGLFVTLPNGETLERGAQPDEGGQALVDVYLAPGSYPVEARAAGRALAASGTLVVEPGESEEPALVLTLD